MAINLDDDGQDWMTKLKRYATDQTGAQADYARSQAKYNYQNSIGDTTGAAASKKWMGQIDTATGGLLSKPTSKVDSAMDKFESYLNSSMNRKAFDPNTDQQYQTALAAARQNVLQGAQTATNNAMVGLGSRGIGNSSVAVDRANQIGQQANARIQTEITPQLMEQAYNRYLAEQNLAQQDLSNLGSFAEMTNNQYQQGLDNAYRDNAFRETQKQNNLGAARAVGQDRGLILEPVEDYSNLYYQAGLGPNFQSQRATADDQYRDNRATRSDFESDRGYNLQERTTNANIANASADNIRAAQAQALSAGNQDLAQKLDIWDRTGQAPAGLEDYGVQAGTPLAGKQSSGGSSGGTFNQKVSQLRQLYTTKGDNGQVRVTDPYALRNAIIANGSSEAEIDQLLATFGLEQNPTYSGGR